MPKISIQHSNKNTRRILKEAESQSLEGNSLFKLFLNEDVGVKRRRKLGKKQDEG